MNKKMLLILLFCSLIGCSNISGEIVPESHDHSYKGDFVTEEVTYVNRWSSTTVKVVGLESCDAPHKGGFCSDTPKKPSR